jgi:hypothetical protein
MPEGSQQNLVPSSSAARAPIWSAVSSHPSSSAAGANSETRAGATDFGMTAQPCCRPQRSRTCRAGGKGGGDGGLEGGEGGGSLPRRRLWLRRRGAEQNGAPPAAAERKASLGALPDPPRPLASWARAQRAPAPACGPPRAPRAPRSRRPAAARTPGSRKPRPRRPRPRTARAARRWGAAGAPRPGWRPAARPPTRAGGTGAPAQSCSRRWRALAPRGAAPRGPWWGGWGWWLGRGGWGRGLGPSEGRSQGGRARGSRAAAGCCRREDRCRRNAPAL